MDNLMTDEIIKRRLLIDGDGVGEDRKVMGLMKGYVAWANSPTPTSPSSLLLTLQQVEQAEGRSYEAIQVNHHSSIIFLRLKSQVAQEILQTKQQITLSKALLEEATKHRKYSMEYDALAKLIQSKPDRRGTDTRRLALQAQLHTLRSRQGSLDLKLEERKKALSMMSSTIERLKELLGDEEGAPTTCIAPTTSPASSPHPLIPILLAPPAPQPLQTPPQLLESQQPTTTTTTTTMMMEVDESESSSSSPISTSNQGGAREPSEEVPISSSSPSQELDILPSALSPHHLHKTKSEKYEDLSESEGD